MGALLVAAELLSVIRVLPWTALPSSPLGLAPSWLAPVVKLWGASASFFWRAWYDFGIIRLGHAMLPEEFIDGHEGGPELGQMEALPPTSVGGGFPRPPSFHPSFEPSIAGAPYGRLLR
jgi:hypothetical protein